MADNNAELIKKLRDAHRDFVMSRLDDNELAATINREVAALYSWGQRVTVNEVIDTEVLIATIQRITSSGPVTEELNRIIVNSVMVGINAKANDDMTLSQLVAKEDFDELVSHAAQYEELRADAISMILNSPVYGDLISDVLYHGIKDYVTGDNFVAKKVPGVSSLMKMGAKSLNKAMPNLEAAAESTIKKFISGNLKNTLEMSEKFLNNALSEKKIKKIADHFWESAGDKKFSGVRDYVGEEEVERGVGLAVDVWLDIRTSDYLAAMIEQVTNGVMDDLGERKLHDLAEDMGYTEAYVIDELEQILPGALGKSAVKEYIELRVDANLDDFYQSTEFEALLAAKE